MISWFMRLSPTSGSALTVWSLLGILSLPLSPLPHLCSLSLSKEINKLKKKGEDLRMGIWVRWVRMQEGETIMVRNSPVR